MTESLCCTPETITTLLINYESGVSLKLAQQYKSIMLQYKVKLKKNSWVYLSKSWLESDSAKLEVVKNAPWIGALGETLLQRREKQSKEIIDWQSLKA